MHDIYNLTPNFLFSFSANGIVTRMNETMRITLGVENLNSGKIKLGDLLSVGSKIFFQTHFFPMIKMQGFAREIFLTFKPNDGPDMPVLLNVVSHLDGNLGEVHCGGMIISNRNRFEKELLLAKKEAQEALSQNADLVKIRSKLEIQQRELEVQLRKLSALHRQQQEIFKVLSHDLQEPLRKAVMFTNLVKTQNSELSEDSKNKLDRIIGFNEQMRQMLLSLQRIEELNNININLQTIDLERLIDTALISSDIDNSKINIEYNLVCGKFDADQKLLKNMFVELLLNSIRFRNPDNEFISIQISCMKVKRNIFLESAENYQYEDFIKLTFADDGVGFNPDTSKVFKIFQRGEQFDSISPGLAYCRKIVELHHGTIIAKSIRGKGAGFTVFIPEKQFS